MKKLFYVVALAAAVVLTGCGKKNGLDSLPEDLRAIIEKADKDIQNEIKNSSDFREMAQYGIEGSYEGVSVEGNDIIFTMKFGGETMKMISFKDLLDNMGFNQRAFESSLRSGELFGEFDEDDKELIELLCKYKYNIGLRIEGAKEGDSQTFRVSYEDLSNMKPAAKTEAAPNYYNDYEAPTYEDDDYALEDFFDDMDEYYDYEADYDFAY